MLRRMRCWSEWQSVKLAQLSQQMEENQGTEMKQPKDAERTKTALDFFKWSLEQGQAQAKALDYVPLPDALVKQIKAHWKTEIK